MTGVRWFLALVAVVSLAAGAWAEERGSVTNLPLPRFVSLKASEGNVRRGPSLTHRIDWVFTRRGMPLQVTAEFGHWRRVRDKDGAGGWMHYSLLSGTRSVIIAEELMPLYMKPDSQGAVAAYLESGVIARLGECNLQFCRLTAERYRGWALKSALWGVLPDEIRE